MTTFYYLLLFNLFIFIKLKNIVGFFFGKLRTSSKVELGWTERQRAEGIGSTVPMIYILNVLSIYKPTVPLDNPINSFIFLLNHISNSINLSNSIPHLFNSVRWIPEANRNKAVLAKNINPSKVVIL